MDRSFAEIGLVVLDIDGTLTDAKVDWAGPEIGWVQKFSVRDGESIRRLVGMGIGVVPLSRNRTLCARARMQGLGLPTDWVGVGDKEPALAEIIARYGVPAEKILYFADGREDVPILEKVGLPCVVADAHPLAAAVARYVTRARGGEHAFEEIADLILEARG